ncbi:hypothetical protein HRI_002604300 [Hibiscus trionum]|uniref:LOB domain-containing protein n=1 Tax=Hibiscus trionum TaxID=183268 RepID=A0A9W7I880_HIBTR|nr:hypothetical protein HRI_002604300 [Hibiscus trionum]
MQNPTASNTAAGSQACAVCKYQRRKCTSNCLLAPFFPANRHKDFLNTRKLFGVRNIIKLIENLSFQQRVIAVKTVVFEANVRAADPVGGCYKYICELNKQIARYQAELDLVNQQLSICKTQSMFTQYQQQQHQQESAQKQKQVVVENDVEQANFDGFNIFDSIRVDNHYSQYLNGDGSSSLMSVYDVFDSIPVKVELEAAASNGIQSCTQQGNVLSDVGEDIKPLLSFLDDKRDHQIYGFDSGGSKSQSSDKLVVKERAGGSVQHQLKPDLNGAAASLFNFTNGKGIDKHT